MSDNCNLKRNKILWCYSVHEHLLKKKNICVCMHVNLVNNQTTNIDLR